MENENHQEILSRLEAMLEKRQAVRIARDKREAESNHENLPAGFSTKCVNEARALWRQRHYVHKTIDDLVAPFLALEKIKDPPGGWLRNARLALKYSAQEIAKRLDMTSSGYCQLERSAAIGKISLRNLEAAANAMDCELIYAIRPKIRTPYSEVIWNRLLPVALAMIQPDNLSEFQKQRRLIYFAVEKSMQSKIRRRFGWTKRYRE